jgi:farnesyl diphosphate synthase
VAAVKEVYRALDLPRQFSEYEASSYERLSRVIEEQALLPKAVFTSLLKKIYKRQK